MFLSTSKGWGASGSGREVEFVWDIYNCVPEEIILIRVLKFEDAQTSKVLCAGPNAALGAPLLSQTSAILLHVLPDEDERTAIAAKSRSAPNFAVVSSSSHPTTERTGLVILAVCDIDGTSPTPSFSVFDTIDLDRR